MMNILKKIITALVCAFLSLFSLLIVDLYIFHGGMGVGKVCVYLLKITEQSHVNGRSADYEKYYEKHIRGSIASNWNLSAFPQDDGIHFSSFTSSGSEISLIGDDGYTLLHQQNGYKLNDTVGFGFVTKMLDSNWVIVAPCSRLVCSEDRFHN